LNSAVVTKAVVMRSSRSASASRSGISAVSRSMPTTAPPFSSAPHTSKVMASNEALEICAIRSPAANGT
jgi:hypothetical protein